MTPCICCLSLQSWGQWFVLSPHLSTDPRRVTDFSICSALYLSGQSGDFQALYMQSRKPEGLVTCFLYSLFFLFFLFFLLVLYLIPTTGICGYYLILPIVSHAQLVSEPCMMGTLGTLYYNIVNVTETPLR